MNTGRRPHPGPLPEEEGENATGVPPCNSSNSISECAAFSGKTCELNAANHYRLWSFWRFHVRRWRSNRHRWQFFVGAGLRVMERQTFRIPLTLTLSPEERE
ncbi:MAG TPA: hypothetical protein VGJ15_06495 [Pirellulales bacterium]|jgi:hypothetical protein